jgi:hypothetical protein
MASTSDSQAYGLALHNTSQNGRLQYSPEEVALRQLRGDRR